MKALVKLFIFSFLVLSVSFAFADVVKADSKIAQVTVYTDSALIMRQANLKLSEGEHTIAFADIIPDVDENSLTVSGKGTAEVKIFGAQIKKEFLEKPPSEQVKDLQNQIQSVDDQIKSENNRRQVFREERDFLNSIKLSAGTQIPKDLITKFPSTGELDSLAKFLATSIQENQSKQEQADINIRDLTAKRKALEEQLRDISSGIRKMQRSIIVEIEASKAGNLDLNISYLVRGVTWRPIYDARASFDKDNVELVLYGMVKQTTGEPWEDIDLILSTAKPSVGGKMPELHPWHVRPYEARRMMPKQAQALNLDYVGMNVYRGGALAPGMGEMGGAEELEKTAVPIYAQAEEKGTAVVYNIKRKATIKSDGTEHKVPIMSQNLAASFEYAATPKLSTYAYLMSKVTNSKEGQLLPGTVNIFLEGDFIGTSYIPKSIGAEEEFDLYLGIDEGITIKRKKLEEKVDDTLIAGLPSRTKSTTYQYKLIVENYKSKKIKVNLYDQIPVSENEQIVIKNVKYSEKPAVENYLDRKGVMRWEFELNPKGVKEITLFYTIEHPRNMNVEGL